MHFYACPYCWDDGKFNGKLFIVTEKDTLCEHKPGLFFNKYKECKENDFKCKEVFQCCVCKSQFRITEDFVKAQRKKIKDG